MANNTVEGVKHGRGGRVAVHVGGRADVAAKIQASSQTSYLTSYMDIHTSQTSYMEARDPPRWIPWLGAWPLLGVVHVPLPSWPLSALDHPTLAISAVKLRTRRWT